MSIATRLRVPTCIPRAALPFLFGLPVRDFLKSCRMQVERLRGKINWVVRCGRMLGAGAMALLVCLPSTAIGQAATPVLTASLPDAPMPEETAPGIPQQASAQDAAPGPTPTFKIGPWRDPKSLDSSMPVVPLSAADKFKLSFQEQLTPFALASVFLAAGWEHLRDSNPKYGSNSTAFAERVGAAALRQTSQAVFSDGVYASVFRQDPRFYRLASGSIGKRILYAASRTWRTRNDSGAPAVNYSLLFGHATAQALTLTYYPDRSQSGQVAAAGFGWSLLGSMLGNQYHEFWPDILQAVLRRPAAGPRPTSAAAERNQVPPQ